MSDETIDYSLHYRRWHDESAQHYDAMARRLERWLGPHIAGIDRHARVLDYGCGFGLLTNYLGARFVNTLGVDASAQQLAAAARRGLAVEHVPVGGYADWVERHPAEFDLVFLFDVLEHVPPQEQIAFLRRLVSTMKPGATLFVKVPNASSPMASRWRYIDWTHWSSFTEASLDFVCLHAGLGEIEHLSDDSSVAPRLRWLPRWGLRHYYVKCLVRGLWRLYLRSEVGNDERQIRLGLNLFARAARVR